MATEKLLHQFEGIKETVTRYDSLLSSIKSPAVIYEEKTVEIRGRITQLWASWASTPASEISRLQDNVVDLGGRLKELEINRDANVQDEEKIYYETLQKTLDALCYELLGLIGPEKIHSYLRNTSSEIPVDHASNNPIVTCQPPTATPQGTISEEASTPSEMLKNNHSSQMTTLVGDKRKGDSLKHTGRKRRKIDVNDHHTGPGIPLASPIPRSSRRQTRHSHRRHGENRSTWDEDFEGITNPDAGGVYLAYWGKSKDWLAVLLLPMQDLQSVGIPGSLESLGLAEVLPACYKNKAGNFSWKEGYNYGEHLVTEREFPVMYFDGQDFPAISAVGWVAAKDLRDFDARSKNSLIPHIQSVHKFLKTRKAKNPPEQGVDKPVSKTPDMTEEQSVELSTNSATLLDGQRQLHESSPPAPCQDQGKPEPRPVTQPGLLSADQTPRPSSSLQPWSSTNILGKEEQKRRTSLEVISISSHESGEGPDKDWGLSKLRPLATPTKMAQNPRQDARSVRPGHDNGDNGTVTRNQPVGTGLSEAFGIAQASIDVSCLSDSSQRGQSLENQSSQALEELKRRPTEPIPASTFDLSIPPTADIELATLRAERQQYAQPEVGGTHGSPYTNHVIRPTPERQLVHQSSSVAGTSGTRPSDAFFNMPQIRPVLSGAEPRSNLTGGPCNPEAPKASLSLPPISLMLGQDMYSQPAPQESFNQAPTHTDLLSFHQTSPIRATRVEREANATPTSDDRPPTTQSSTQLPAIQPSPGRASSTHHPLPFPPEGPNYDSLDIRASALTAPTDGNPLTSPGMSTLHPGSVNTTQFPRDLGVAYPKGDWYKLPRDLTDYLEKYQRDNNLGIGTEGLRVASGHYVCPFCRESKRKPCICPGPFSSHLARHWATLTNNLAVSSNSKC